MRVIPNGEGCEILFTVLQLAGRSDEQFGADLEAVRADLGSLRDVLIGGRYFMDSRDHGTQEGQ